MVVTVMLAICGYVLAGYGMKKHFITETDIYIETSDGSDPNEKAAIAALLFTSPRMYDALQKSLAHWSVFRRNCRAE